MLDRLNASFDALEEIYTEIVEDETDETRSEAVLVQWQRDTTRTSDAIESVTVEIINCDLACLPAIQPAVQPAVAAAAGRAPKINNHLKPFILTKDHTPVELKSWVDRFRTYFSTSRMDLCTIIEQQAYFRSCLDSFLDDRIINKIDANTPVFGAQPADDCCVNTLEEIFRRLYQGQLYTWTEYCPK